MINVTRIPITFEPAPRSVRMLLLLLVPVAMLAGLYGRFKGIGTWPLGVDEFYASRSIDHVLLTGWPRFPCGGYYTRGLRFQYVVAGCDGPDYHPNLRGRSSPRHPAYGIYLASRFLSSLYRGPR
jgi:hypothetical protein